MLKICVRCRRLAYKDFKRVKSDTPEGEELSIMEPQPSTSQYDLEEIPSATSINSTSSEASVAAEISRAHNIQLVNKGIAGMKFSDPDCTRNEKNTVIISSAKLVVQ